ncbi:hypothetical protein E2542_SST16928 [Spatholobus suberectus]|nr:hypothetical protein E2542_SST16928 [Spatholobus suberectus]
MDTLDYNRRTNLQTKERYNVISKSGAGQLDLLILDALKKVPPCLIGGLTLAQKNVTW